MPQVPKLEERVGTEPLPGVRVSAAPTPETYGGQVGNVAENVGRAVFTRAVREEDEAAVLSVDNDLAQKQMMIHEEVTKLQGKDALGSNDLIKKLWKESTTEAMKGLSNDRQRKVADAYANNRYLQLERFGLQHSFTEHEAHKDKLFMAYMGTSLDSIRLQAADPDALRMEGPVDKAKKDMLRAIDEQAARKGFSGTPVHQAMVDKAVSGANVQALESMLMKSQDQKAKQFYEENKKNFSADDRNKVEKQVQEGSYRGDSRRALDEYQGQYLDEAEMLKKVRGIADPKLADLVEERVRLYWNREAEREKKLKDDLYEEDSKTIAASTKGVPLDDVVPSWLSHDAAARAALRKQWEEHQEPHDGGNDDDLFYKFRELGASAIAALSFRDFSTQYLVHFDKHNRDRAVDIRAAAKDASTKPGDLKFTHMQSNNEMIKNSFSLSGMVGLGQKETKWNDQERALYARFERDASRSIHEYEMSKYGGKQHATPAEVEKVLQEVTDRHTRKVLVPGFLFGTSEKLAAQVVEVENGKEVVQLKNIPNEDIEDIKAQAAALGRLAPISKIKRAYAFALTHTFVKDGKNYMLPKDREKLMSILGE